MELFVSSTGLHEGEGAMMESMKSFVKTIGSLLSALLIAVCLVPVCGAYAGEPTGHPHCDEMGWSSMVPGEDCVANHFIIGFNDSVSAAQRDRILSDLGLEIDQLISWTDSYSHGKIVAVAVPQGMDVFDAIEYAFSSKYGYLFEYVEPDALTTIAFAEDPIKLDEEAGHPYCEKMGWASMVPGEDCVADHVIVGLKDTATEKMLEDVFVKYLGVEIDSFISWTDKYPHGKIVTVAVPEGMDVFDTIEYLHKDGIFNYYAEYVEPDALVTIATAESWERLWGSDCFSTAAVGAQVEAYINNITAHA